MLNWYRFANNDLALSRDIYLWLLQAGKGNPDFATMHDDISARMEGVDSPEALSNAIQSASAMVARSQGGLLNPDQQEMIRSLNERMQGPENPMIEFVPDMDTNQNIDFNPDMQM